ncbi:MAG: hypothetical protein LBN11_02155, partial [Tannerella sp.]|nr:hypothetical protein [Tannerella sp.]
VPEELLDKELYLHAIKDDIFHDKHWIGLFWDLLGFRKILEVARQVNPNVSEDDYPEDKHLLGVWEQKAS